MKKQLLYCYMLTMAAGVWAEEAIVTLHSTVSGSQEQPRVMYIVPWQEPGAARFNYELQGGFGDELFGPIDRDEFVRGLAYREILDPIEGGSAEQAQQETFD